MRRHNLNYIAVGLFLCAMTVATVVSMAVLAGRTGSNETYAIVFDNVADVKFGTVVRFEGYPIGQVEDISPVVDGDRVRFRVDVAVEDTWHIPADSIARVGSSSILGARTIEIERGESTVAVAPGGRISSAPAQDIIAAITTVADDIGALNRDMVRPLFQDIRNLVTDMGAELRDLSARLNESVASVQQILSPANVASVETIVASAATTSQDLAALSRDLQGTAARVDSLVVKLDAVMEENRGNVSGTLEDARYVLRSLAENIDTINHNLEGTSRNLNEFSRQIRNNPGLLLGSGQREEVDYINGSRGGRQVGAQP